MKKYLLNIALASPIAYMTYILMTKFVDPVEYLLENSGYYGFMVMIVSLSLSSIKTLTKVNTNWMNRGTGIWVFVYTVIHMSIYFLDQGVSNLISVFALTGVAAASIFFTLTVTSNKWAQNLLRKNWKKLHRMVYLAALLVVIHVATNSKVDAGEYYIPFALMLLTRSIAYAKYHISWNTGK